MRTCSELWEKYDSLITANLMLVMDYSLKTHYHNILEQDKSFGPHFCNWLILKSTPKFQCKEFVGALIFPENELRKWCRWGFFKKPYMAILQCNLGNTCIKETRHTKAHKVRVVTHEHLVMNEETWSLSTTSPQINFIGDYTPSTVTLIGSTKDHQFQIVVRWWW